MHFTQLPEMTKDSMAAAKHHRFTIPLTSKFCEGRSLMKLCVDDDAASEIVLGKSGHLGPIGSQTMLCKGIKEGGLYFI